MTDTRSIVGESPVWCERIRRLFWTDVIGQRLRSLDPESGTCHSLDLPSEAGSVVLDAVSKPVLALRDGWYRLCDDDVRRIAAPGEMPPCTRMNDASVGPSGEVFCGSMNDEGPGGLPTGCLWRLDPDGAVTEILRGLVAANGLAVSPDGRTVYLSDSGHAVRRIWSFDYEPESRALRNRQVFFDTASVAGRPDGGTVDTNGCYWMAGVGGSHLLRLDPKGRIDLEVALPVSKPSKIAFGGADFRDIFVTTISRDIEPDVEPLAGHVLTFRIPGVQGLPTRRFAGVADAA